MSTSKNADLQHSCVSESKHNQPTKLQTRLAEPRLGLQRGEVISDALWHSSTAGSDDSPVYQP